MKLKQGGATGEPAESAAEERAEMAAGMGKRGKKKMIPMAGKGRKRGSRRRMPMPAPDSSFGVR